MLLDTTFLIDLQRELGGGRSRGAQAFLRDHAADIPCISLITWMEFAEGAADGQEESSRLFLSVFRVIAPDLGIAWKASRISRALRAKGTPIGDHDCWIAATAIMASMTLVTRNSKHFHRVTELRLLAY